MRQHRPLGRARRAAGILQHRQIARRLDRDGGEDAVIGDELVEADMRAIARHRHDVAALQQTVERAFGERQNIGHRAQHDLAQAILPGQRRHRRVELLHVERHHDGDLGILDEVTDLGRRVERVEIDDDAAGLQHGVIGDDVIGGVGQHQPDAHAAAHAERGEALGGAPHEPADFGIGIRPAEEIEAGAVAEAGDAIVEELVERLLREAGAPFDVRRIGLEPRPPRLDRFHVAHPEFPQRLYFSGVVAPRPMPCAHLPAEYSPVQEFRS